MLSGLVLNASADALTERLATGFVPGHERGNYWAMASGYRASFDSGGVQLLRQGRRVAIRFPGSRLRWEGEGRASAQVTFLGEERRTANGRDALRAPGAFPGIDILIRVKDGRLKSEFQMAAGVRTDLAGYCVEGAAIRASDDGKSLHVDAGDGWEWEEKGLESWQTDSGGKRLPVPSKFRVKGQCVRFELANVDPALPLTIDPELVFSSYMGGGLFDTVTAVATDAVGNLYLGGWTESSDFPQLGSYQSSSGGRIDGFVAKIGTAGQLVFATYLGGLGEDRVQAIAVNGAGAITVAGLTSSTNFPVYAAARGVLAGGRDAFVTQLTAAGNQLTYSTYLGGSSNDAAMALALDSSGNAVVGGETASSDFPTQAAFRTVSGGGVDGFVARLSPAGTLLSSTYFGGGADDRIRGVAVGPGDVIHVTGATASSNFPVLAAPYLSLRGSMDAFYTRLNSAATGMSLSTYLGGSAGSAITEESGYGITVDPLGRTWIAGVTPSADFPGVSAGNQSAYGGGISDAFVSVFTVAGSLEWSTYIGGAGLDAATAISSGSGFVGLAGYTTSNNFPVSAALQTSRSGEYDAFWAIFPTTSTVPLYVSYIGGSGSDSALAAAAAGSTLVIGGSTLSSNFPVQSAIQSSNPGTFGGFATRLRFGPGPLTVTPEAGSGLTGTFSLKLSHANGHASILNAGFLLNASYTFVNGCYVYYDRGTNLISLYKDAGATWLSISPGAGTTVDNGVCTVHGSGVSVTTNQNALTISLPITFSQGFGGNKLIFANANDTAGLGAGWPQIGTWNVPAPSAPSVGAITPSSGTGLAQVFSAVFSDTNGASDIAAAGVLFNTTSSTGNGCYYEWRRSTNTIVLFRDSDSSYLPVTPGITGTVENANCSINGAGASVIESGTQVTLTVPVAFKPSVVGARSTYTYAADSGGLSTGWQSGGSWVPVAAEAPTVASLSPSSGSGGSQAFTAIVYDGNGFGDLTSVEFLLNTSPVSTGGCHVRYDLLSNTALLFRHADQTWLPIAPGSPFPVGNNYCNLLGSGLKAAGSGNTMTITLFTTFANEFSGAKSIYLRAIDRTGLSSGWVEYGSWTVSQTSAPTLASITPNSGAGAQQNFTVLFADTDGHADVASGFFLMNSSLSAAAGCFIGFNRAQNIFQLFRDSDNTWQPIVPGSNTSVANDSCTLSGVGLSLRGSGTTVSMVLPLTFRQSFSGIRNIYVNVTDSGGLTSGWLGAGNWTPSTPLPPVLTGVSPTAATVLAQTFTVTARDGNGSADINKVYFLVSTDTAITANSCHGFYDRTRNGLYLYNDALTEIMGPMMPGAAGTLQNGQCLINSGASAALEFGTDLILNLNVSRQGSYATGSKTLYVWLKDNANNNTGWIIGSSWSIAMLTPVAPTLSGASPGTTTTASQTFAVTARDGNGFADINKIYFLVNTDTSIPANSCHGFYDREGNGLYLYNDALTAVMGPLTPGTAGTLQNGQCAIGAAASSVSASGAELVLNLNLTLQGSYAVGNRTLYLWVKDNGNNNTGWIAGSNWTMHSPTPVAPTLAGVSPTAATTASQTFTVIARDGNGYTDINKIYFLVNTDPSVPADSCHGFYDRASNGLFLYNDALTAVMGPITPGAAGTLQNGQCAINGGPSSVTGSGSELVLNLNVTRQGTYVFGSKTTYFWVTDNLNNNTGWITGSTWAVPSPLPVAPTLAGVSPATATAASQTFAVIARDGNGFADVNKVYFLVNSDASIPANSCHGFYDRAGNGLYLYNDGLTAVAGPITPGAAGTLQNSQCGINAATSSVSAAGSDVVLNLSVTRQGSYAPGNKTLYIWVKDNANNNTGWIAGSTWAIPNPTPAAPTLAGVSPATAATASETFAVTARDDNGYSDINKIYFLVNSDTSIPAYSCHGFYDRASDGIYLYNDTLTAVMGPILPGAAGSLQNGQCGINGAASSVTAVGSDVVLNLNLTRQGAYASGNKTFYVWVKDNINNNTGWIAGSTWTLAGQ